MGTKKGCKVISLKNKSIFKLFVVSGWLSSSQMHNGILTEQEIEQNLKEVMGSNKENIAPKSNAAGKNTIPESITATSRTCCWASVMSRLYRLPPP